MGAGGRPEPVRPTVATVLGRDDTVTAGTEEAVRRDARLVLIAAPDIPAGRVGRAVRRCRARAPGLDVVVVRDRACRYACCARPPVTLVVEPSDVTSDLLGAARTEILVTPAPVPASGPVVLGMAAWTGGTVVRAADREARTRDAELQVVRAWSDPGVDPGVVRPDVLRRWDEVDTRLRSDAEQRLDGLRCADAGPVRTLVVMDSAPEALALFARTARLLVVGHRADADPAPLVTLARSVRCPLLIVPDGDDRPAGI